MVFFQGYILGFGPAPVPPSKIDYSVWTPRLWTSPHAPTEIDPLIYGGGSPPGDEFWSLPLSESPDRTSPGVPSESDAIVRYILLDGTLELF